MQRIELTAIVTALALAGSAPVVAAQDTTAVGRNRPDTSGYVPATGVDTSARPGRVGALDTTGTPMDTTMGARADTAGWHRTAGDSMAPDSTKPGDRSTRKPRHHERRMHPGSDTTVTAPGARRSGAAADTSGMPGRHRSDTSAAAGSRRGPTAPDSSGEQTSTDTTKSAGHDSM